MADFDDNLPESFKRVLPYLPQETTVDNLEESLDQALETGTAARRQEIDDVLSFLSQRGCCPSITFTKGAVAKTKMFSEVAGEQRVRILKELHDAFGTAQAVAEALDIAMGRPTRSQRGEIAADEMRKGTSNNIPGMKPLRFKRGFVSMGF